jgi:hypothetical protein
MQRSGEQDTVESPVDRMGPFGLARSDAARAGCLDGIGLGVRRGHVIPFLGERGRERAFAAADLQDATRSGGERSQYERARIVGSTVDQSHSANAFSTSS